MTNETLQAIEHLLNRAQEGRLIGIAFIGIEHGRKQINGWAGEAGHDPYFAMGAIQQLTHDLAAYARSRKI